MGPPNRKQIKSFVNIFREFILKYRSIMCVRACVSVCVSLHFVFFYGWLYFENGYLYLSTKRKKRAKYNQKKKIIWIDAATSPRKSKVH